ncbi:hypothetical protein O6H91_04G112500 [Diphasiastrum complanatum]|uniref:Uncharacterized protein n=1 Tax=Diphasiastrum complanatum TaxID=34168 RepID=A0ACC2E0V3_DIPCM|nr:hypothetical protein O6H91_04G112500 [Diphasiastrum complanatum]
MAKALRPSLLLLASISLLLLSCHFRHCCASEDPKISSSDAAAVQVEEDELDEFEDDDSTDELHQHGKQDHEAEEEAEEEEDDDDVDSDQGWGNNEGDGVAIDDKEVVVLTGKNFSEVLLANHFVMVEFYAPWCGHCQALAPEYARASVDLKGEVLLAKVDATLEHQLAQHYEVQGYPTLLFFIDGVPKPYSGHRTGEEIVKWVKRKVGPAVTNILSISDAEVLLDAEGPIAVAYLKDLEGAEAEEFTSAARQDDHVLFYQTNDLKVAQLLPFKKELIAPALVLLKKQSERVSHFDGKFERSAIAEFVFKNKLPLVIFFNRENASLIFESSIKKQVLLFASPDEATSIYPLFEEASKSFKGKVIFVYVDTNDTDLAFPVLQFFGISGEKPTIMGFTAVENGNKYLLEGDLSVDSIKKFGEGSLSDTLKPFLKSDPIPKKNDGDVKIVVGNNFEDIVLDESKDVLLEIYAPWCGHCQALEPIYNKLGKRLRGIESLVIAKMDGTSNEHTRAKADGFPTLLFYPAGKKSFDPVISLLMLIGLPRLCINSLRSMLQFLLLCQKATSRERLM